MCAKKCVRECKTCHRPFHDLAKFQLDDKRCDACQRKYLKNKGGKKKRSCVTRPSTDLNKEEMEGTSSHEKLKKKKKKLTKPEEKPKKEANVIISPGSDEDADDYEEEEEFDVEVVASPKHPAGRTGEEEEEESEEGIEYEEGPIEEEEEEEEEEDEEERKITKREEVKAKTLTAKIKNSTVKPVQQPRKVKARATTTTTGEPKAKRQKRVADKEIRENLLRSLLEYSTLSSSKKKTSIVKFEIGL